MITKPRGFIYRLDRKNDSVTLCDMSKVISIEVDTDLNKRTIVVKTANPDMFRRVIVTKGPKGNITRKYSESETDYVTYNFLMCFNYKGAFMGKFWEMYMKEVDQVMPSAYIAKRKEVCEKHNLVQKDDEDYIITTTRVFTDMILVRRYVDSDGIYAFEFIPITKYIFDKAPLIPEDSEDVLKEYSEASGITVNQIKENVYKRFGYIYSGYNDIQDHIRMMMLKFLKPYGITVVNPVQDFKRVSDFGKRIAAPGVSLGALIDYLRKNFYLRIWQEYPGYAEAIEFYEFSSNQLVMTTEPYGTDYSLKAMLNSNFDRINLSYTDVIKTYGMSTKHHLYDLFTDISVQAPDGNRNNALLLNSSVQLATGMKLKLTAVVELKKFGDLDNYDVYLRSTLVNNTNFAYDYGTKYVLRKFVNGKMSELPLSSNEFNAKMFPTTASTMSSPMASPYKNEETVTAQLLQKGIEACIDNFTNTIRCQCGSVYKLELEFNTPLFQQSVANIIYVNQILPYNTNGTRREGADTVLYVASVDRIIETLDRDGYSFNVHCGTGEKIEEINF